MEDVLGALVEVGVAVGALVEVFCGVDVLPGVFVVVGVGVLVALGGGVFVVVGVAVFVAPGTAVFVMTAVPDMGVLVTTGCVAVAVTGSATGAGAGEGKIVTVMAGRVGVALLATAGAKVGDGPTVPTTCPSTWLATTAVGVGSATGLVAGGRGVSVAVGAGWQADVNIPINNADRIIFLDVRLNVISRW
ncbi:MAG TPA: hypothetical protein PLJ62_06725 [Thermoflexales bacterium]|nr:hypothetical protein [Thermoflexales bacterium]HQZ99870.1 hypothetical protein [Thermoflexales bacterium]